MHTFIRTAAVLLSCITIIASAGCQSTTTTAKRPVVAAREVAVKRGSISTTVSIDGNLVMPEASSLAFGASGNVKEVFVKEGDRVKAGAIMATLENTTQMLDIKSSNISLQKVLASLYEKVPRLPQFPGYIYDANTTTTTTTTEIWERVALVDPDSGLPITDTVTGLQAYGQIHTGDITTTKSTTTYTLREGEIRTPVYPGYYPNATSLNSFNWASGEIFNAYSYFLSENYTAALSEMNIAIADLEATAKIIEDTVTNPESGLGNTSPYINDDNEIAFLIQNEGSFAAHYSQVLRKLVADIRQQAGDINAARELILQKKYSEAAPLYNTLLIKMDGIGKSIISNYNIIKVRNDTKVYGQDICLELYAAADEKLNAALKGIETGGLNSQELSDNLRIARHYMELCNGILGTNDYVLQHGLSLKAEQGYKIDLAKAMVDLGNKRDDFLKTVIMSPFDGIVVNVGVKNNDVLSAQDYSSKTIQVVDTTQIKFTGTVDEIDIMKIKPGQKATVSIDAVTDRTFPGRVSFISPFGTTSGSVVKFNITILLDPTDIDLKGGLTASADVAISTIEDALMLPASAVTTTADGATVTVKDATGKLEKKKVTTGMQNTQYIQILSGLNEGDKVIIEDRAAGAPVSTTFGPPPGAGGPPPGGGGGPPR